MECLISLTKQKREDIWSIKICKDAPSINHFLFADNSMIFYKESLDENTQIQSLVKVYEAASGQVINMAKTSLTFSHNTPPNLKNDILDM